MPYDSLDPMLLANWMIAQGAPPVLAAAMVRLKLSPLVVLRAGGRGTTMDLNRRTAGSWTGSRIAAATGLIPVADALRASANVFQRCGVRISDHVVLSVCTYVDNIFAIAPCADRAVQMLRAVEAHLRERWRLHIKDGRREILVVRHSLEDDAEYDGSHHSDWKYCSSMRVLGHHIDGDGTHRTCWKHTRRSMWACFWKSAGARRTACLPTPLRLQLLTPTCRTVLDFRAPRWAPCIKLCKDLNALQNKMLAILLRSRPLPLEVPPAFARRRGREAAVLARAMGQWGPRQADRARSWFDHLLRRPQGPTWPALLLQWKNSDWFREQRVAAGSLATAGRTRTRAAAGPVPTRWEEGVRLQRARL